MPIGACSNASSKRTCASRSVASMRRRSEMSRRFTAIPSIERVVHQVGAERLEVDPVTVGVQESELERVGLDASGVSVARDRDERFVEVVGMDERGGVATDQLVDAVAEDLLDRAAHVADPQIGADDRDEVGRAGDERAEALFVLFELRRALDERGDVGERHRDEVGATVGVEVDDDGVGRHPPARRRRVDAHPSRSRGTAGRSRGSWSRDDPSSRISDPSRRISSKRSSCDGALGGSRPR